MQGVGRHAPARPSRPSSLCPSTTQPPVHRGASPGNTMAELAGGTDQRGCGAGAVGKQWGSFVPSFHQHLLNTYCGQPRPRETEGLPPALPLRTERGPEGKGSGAVSSARPPSGGVSLGDWAGVSEPGVSPGKPSRPAHLCPPSLCCPFRHIYGAPLCADSTVHGGRPRRHWTPGPEGDGQGERPWLFIVCLL